MAELRSWLKTAELYFKSVFRWLLIAVITGVICGLIGSAFHLIVSHATGIREKSPWLLYLLPVGGLFIAGLYKLTKTEGEGTNNIIASIHEGERIPAALVPVIFVATALTHLFGGSAGREGAALQIGGGIGYGIGRMARLDEKDMRIVTLCGMSAVFAALFGTPLTATVFALEVISVGILHYAGFLPCLLASTVAYGISRLIGIEPMRFAIAVQHLDVLMLLRVCILGVVCALVSILFCVVMHKTEHILSDKLKNTYLRAFLGGTVIIALTLLVGTRDYNGIGTAVIERALSGEVIPGWAFFWKMLFTAVTIGAGFKGGEIVPTFFVGAALGAVVAPLIDMPSAFGAALGLVAVFCGAVNCPLASIILSVELFGSGELIYFALACGISYMLSGYFGLYSRQKIMYSKVKAEFINRYAR